MGGRRRYFGPSRRVLGATVRGGFCPPALQSIAAAEFRNVSQSQVSTRPVPQRWPPARALADWVAARHGAGVVGSVRALRRGGIAQHVFLVRHRAPSRHGTPYRTPRRSRRGAGDWGGSARRRSGGVGRGSACGSSKGARTPGLPRPSMRTRRGAMSFAAVPGGRAIRHPRPSAAPAAFVPWKMIRGRGPSCRQNRFADMPTGVGPSPVGIRRPGACRVRTAIALTRWRYRSWRTISVSSTSCSVSPTMSCAAS